MTAGPGRRRGLFAGWLDGPTRLAAPGARRSSRSRPSSRGLLGIWLFGRIEGGVLDPIAYLGEVEGRSSSLLSLARRRAGSRRRRHDDGAARSRLAPAPPDRGRQPRIVAVVDDWSAAGGSGTSSGGPGSATSRRPRGSPRTARPSRSGSSIGYRSPDRPDEAAIVHLVGRRSRTIAGGHRPGAGRRLRQPMPRRGGVDVDRGRRLARTTDRGRVLPGARLPSADDGRAASTCTAAPAFAGLRGRRRGPRRVSCDPPRSSRRATQAESAAASSAAIAAGVSCSRQQPPEPRRARSGSAARPRASAGAAPRPRGRRRRTSATADAR